MSEWVSATGDMDIGSEGFGLSAGAQNADAAQRLMYQAWPWRVEEGGELTMIPVEVRVRVAPWWIREVQRAEARLEAGEDADVVEEALINARPERHEQEHQE